MELQKICDQRYSELV